MATKKPWRTVITGTSTGRFTREQIRDAMDSVSSKRKPGGTGSKADPSPQNSAADSQAAESGGSVRSKSAGGAKGQQASSRARESAPKGGSAATSKGDRSTKARKDTRG